MLPISHRALSVALAVWLVIGIQWVEAQTRGMERRQDRRQEAIEEFPDLPLRIVNPLARILTLPTSFEYKEGGGRAGNGQSFAIRTTPRVPFVLNDDWTLVSRFDLAWVSQTDVVGRGSQQGLTDLGLTMILSPNRSLGRDIYWGLGVAAMLPTATDDFLGEDKLSIGPSFAFFKQTAPWTMGIQLTQRWSVAGSGSAPDVNVSVIKGLIAHTTPTATTIALGLEFRHDWERNQWAGPLELSVRQLTMIRNRPVHWSLGAQHFVLADGAAPEWGAFFRVTLPLKSPAWTRKGRKFSE